MGMVARHLVFILPSLVIGQIFDKRESPCFTQQIEVITPNEFTIDAITLHAKSAIISQPAGAQSIIYFTTPYHAFLAKVSYGHTDHVDSFDKWIRLREKYRIERWDVAELFRLNGDSILRIRKGTDIISKQVAGTNNPLVLHVDNIKADLLYTRLVAYHELSFRIETHIIVDSKDINLTIATAIYHAIRTRLPCSSIDVYISTHPWFPVSHTFPYYFWFIRSAEESPTREAVESRLEIECSSGSDPKAPCKWTSYARRR
jgi:hypothetical protein